MILYDESSKRTGTPPASLEEGLHLKILLNNSSGRCAEPLALSRKTSAQNHDELSPALQSTKSHVLQRGTRRHQGKAQREVAVTHAVSLVPSPAALFGTNQRRNGHASAVLNASTVRTVNILRASSLPDEVKKQVIVTEALPPRLYGLPKIHKRDIPLRPIVSAIGAPTFLLVKHLTTLLQPYIGEKPSYIRDSAHFVEKLRKIRFNPGDILVSFDVVSLFTKVSLVDPLRYIAHLFPPDITNLFKHCLMTSYFVWDGSFYEQTDGVAMGSPSSPVVANPFMEQFESLAIETAVDKPTVWWRYVDDACHLATRKR
ncbi:hypothetical protein Trydic_g2034 [Trypoxylus dichotomus]